MKRLISFCLSILMAITCLTVVVPTASTPQTVEAAGSKLVAFTFDDGPSYLTPYLLDELKALDAKVTFFMNGKNGLYSGIVNRPNELSRMVADGHQVANHTYGHCVPFDSLSASMVSSEVEGVNALLYNAVGGKYQTLVRTPGGALSSTIRSNVGSPIILWNLDTFDWKVQNATTVYNNIMNQVGDGSVILLHDLYEPSIEGALRAMKALKSRGYEFVTVSELYRRRGISLTNGEAYYGAWDTGVDLPPYQAPSIECDMSTVVGCSRVTMTAKDSGLTLYYTTDGSVPTLADARYTGPVDIPCDTTLTVAGFDAFATRTPIATAKVEKQYEGVFDAAYYADRYPDLKERYGYDENKLLNHFLTIGLHEGKQASPVFSVNYYMTHNADLQRVYGENKPKYMAHFQSAGMKEGRRGSVQFDPVSYRKQYPDLRRAYGDDWKAYYRHFLRVGLREHRAGAGCLRMVSPLTVYDGVDYAAVYDYQYYTDTYPDILKTFGCNDEATLRHFVKCGMKEGRRGNTTFDVRSYYRQYPDLRKVYNQSWNKYYLHYVKNGRREGRQPNGCTALVSPITTYGGVDYAAVYNYEYYTATYPDILNTFGDNDAAVVRHFAIIGMKEGRQGCASFSVDSYYNQYPDLRKAFKNDLAKYYNHYIKCGKREGRKGIGTIDMIGYTTVYNGVDYAAVYDFNHYIDTYPDLKKAFAHNEQAALRHFVTCGIREGRQASPTFSVTAYAARYADLQKAFGNDRAKYVNHYLKCGLREGRSGL